MSATNEKAFESYLEQMLTTGGWLPGHGNLSPGQHRQHDLCPIFLLKQYTKQLV